MKKRLVILGLWLFGAFALVCHYAPILKLRDVRVVGAPSAQTAAIYKLLDAHPGDNLMRVDLGAWAERIAALPGIAGARAYVTPGGTAVARVTPDEVACLVDTDPVAGAGYDGLIVPLCDHEAVRDVPLVRGIGGEPAYYRRNGRDELISALAFCALWRRHAGPLKSRLSEVRVTADGEIEIYLWPDARYIKLGRGDWQKTITGLAAVLARLPDGNGNLDLRFAGQVIERT